MRRYGSKQVSRAYHRAALQLVLVQRETLDSINIESLARSHGLTPAEVEKAIASERERRAA